MKLIMEGWKRFLNETVSSHWHEYPPSEEIKRIIDNNEKKIDTSVKLPGSCQDESCAWAEVFKDEGIDVEIHHGMYKNEGHTWLVVNGKIFDPTADQFSDDFPDMKEFEYLTHEVEE